jgi:hypothetical protein
MRLSASQIQTFTDCQRKWAWRILEGIEEPPNKSAELGRAVHAQLEKYLTGGAIDFTAETGYIAASGLHHLPAPGSPGLLVEQEFHFEGPSGHTYLGYKDLEVPKTGAIVAAPAADNDIGIVYDHKTTSDLKWQKTEEQLRSDIQATLYAVDYFRKHPDEPQLELRWVYYQTKNTKKSAVTRLRVNQTETWQRFLEIEQIAEQMDAASQPRDGRAVRALDLPANVNHCGAYGGCPHQGRCNLSPFDKMRSHVEQNRLTMLLKTKTKNGAGTPPPDVHTQVAAAVAGHQPPLAFQAGGAFHGTDAADAASAPATTGNKLLSRMRAGGAPAAATVSTAAAPAATAAPAPGAINPPEHQPPPAPPATAAAAAVAAPLPATVEETGRELAASLHASDPVAAGAAGDKRGRGRPSKATLPATGLAVKIKTLYINCGPVGVEVTDASQLIALAKQRITAETQLADYRFAEYGQGPGMLAIAAVAALDALPGLLHAVRLDTTTPEGSIIAAELVARAELVVR